MIIAAIDERTLAFRDGRILIDPPDRRIERRFAEPVRILVGSEAIEAGVPVVVRRRVKVAPGDPDHFRQVVRDLGATILVDEGD